MIVLISLPIEAALGALAIAALADTLRGWWR